MTKFARKSMANFKRLSLNAPRNWTTNIGAKRRLASSDRSGADTAISPCERSNSRKVKNDSDGEEVVGEMEEYGRGEADRVHPVEHASVAFDHSPPVLSAERTLDGREDE